MSTPEKVFDFFGVESGGSGPGGGEANAGQNLGSGEGLYAGKSGVILQFKSLISSSPVVSWSSTPDEVELDFDPSQISHSDLRDLGSDDHPQYLTEGRHSSIHDNPHQVTLDQAYSEGNLIEVDSDPVILDASSNTKPPLRLVPQSSTPADSLEDGSLFYKEGELYVYDSSRSKFLSVSTSATFLFGRGSANQGSQYLRMINGAPSSVSGYRLPWDACLVAMSAQSRSSMNALFHVRRNSTPPFLYTLTVSGASGDQVSNVNVDFNAGDFLQVYMRVLSGRVHYPEVVLILKRRV